eukprot:scaffold586780_cov22-Prasinocladus_malaysianus.AAC.1
MDAGMLGEARALLEDEGIFPPAKPRGVRELYSLALIEYVAWAILGEQGASEEVATAAVKVAAMAARLSW